ncbi:response regulator transcription factor [Paraburkholderia sp. J67]|uniref:response regulator transcription factor n=1 Tax=Paraburkholderia sp. J67 TaxID=2805435 RepID=UPI002ABE21E1|nr:response regulator transcription factor [Paraburkholderia sp. J67]
MKPVTPIGVFLVEDDPRMREAFERMVDLHPDLVLLGSVTTIADAKACLAHIAPNVAIVDLGLPDGDGASLIEFLRASLPDTAILVSTIFGDETHVVRAIEAGAGGYLLKDTTLDEFARSILLVVSGDAPLSPQIARHLLKRFAPPNTVKPTRPPVGAQDLTPREIAILEQIASGFSVAETAASLGISAHTVATHVKNIYAKLAVTNRQRAVNEARLRGMIR